MSEHEVVPVSMARRRIAAAIIAMLVLATAAVLVVQWAQAKQAPSASEVETASPPALAGPRIVFRNTAIGDSYGLVAAVPLHDPGAKRTLSALACDRVDASPARTVCLRTVRGVLSKFEAVELGADGSVHQRALPGIPSRTRISPDEQLVATTSFVSGHSYATIGFSTETVITDAAGASSGNLEDFALLIDGARITAADRNIWGVTFTDDGRTFYATAATGGRNWLVHGDLEARTLTSIREGVECPSLSPDGTRIGFKSVSTDDTAAWGVSVLDLVDGTVVELPIEGSVDDQVAWLDDETLLYGMPREGEPGDSDIWAVAADGGSAPRILIEHGWSPAVVRR
ncbi:hypothetical protein [Ruicaihuangia caeni]|uniref:hypothetical protein n=1 Tax=Ruicaihuangia caeni TaxID=3042517 RepID=UPI0033903CF4